MKKLLSIFLAISILFSLTSCNTKISKRPDKMVVYASFYPLYDLTKKIAGDKVVAQNIIPPGVEPHDWEPTTRQVADIERASVVIYLGLGMDSWINKVETSVSGPKFINVSTGINAIKVGNAVNPHVWLSPKETQILAKNIKDALVNADNKNAKYYQSNYENLVKTLKQLDNEYTTKLKNTKTKTFVVYHSAFDYIARDYGLNQVSIVGMSEEAEASPAKIAEVIKLIKDENIKYIFTEPLTSPKPIQSIANETGTKVLPLNTIEGITKDEMKKGYDYIKLMQQNLDNLQKALN
ncbi:metal ABC transporter solute-binding protein, Zn/Mn family [Thermoanaerobacterium thermosaccharolyticum]|uniref:ABC-type metal ion transport system, periplasmic component/surface adhesin n=1 Tax=Thermoanaerobacterium thermosaccharolyticum M0795 TaxID=698948 RepID=L0IP13_THETR|nr:zinc ABC transporter substrate-binding protein [Thermoanaerobacterium thermosaccharolyticum]AGB19956.1 ABC-type metal ion transport system, periplasmic component/surface adhesin [Thermoanaerobacterium thermosaccharolyticum M0795]